MSLTRIENTSLWKSSLGRQKKDLDVDKRDELRSAFIKFRENVEHLVSHISNTLPSLTRHDVSHLDALWETASLITGTNYPLNALEGFVLGGAILLHDSALCAEAYEGGISQVRETIIWKDVYAALSESKQNQDEDAHKYEADFAALRHLHAEQSSKLIERNWIDPDTKESIYLIEDYTLRKHLGQIIGQISASHHWDIEKVSASFAPQVNALATFPRDWRIDPIKIACILRCADAAHIDNERAPDFLHALIRRRGISFDHWQAQNKLANVDIDQSDINATSLLYTSARNFTENEADSWWIAYDAAGIVDKEIRSANSLLEAINNGNTPSFKVKKVRGADSPELMINYIKVEGWTPCSANIHVGNVEKLVKNLGGEQLYGAGSYEDLLQISVRELIQNARDSIQARIIIEPSFQGKITIKLRYEEETAWLFIEDNGVGMSERVLTGPLLDFGTSFWTSTLVQSEFPGLRSSKFKAVGRFGIGFYSVFMVAKEVYVSSKPWKEGIINIKQLQFKNGLSFRPLLKQGPVDDFSSLISTQVKVRLKENIINKNGKIDVKRNLMHSSNLTVDLADYLAVICSGLDVPVFFTDESENQQMIHQSVTDNDFNVQNWLEKISLSKQQGSEITEYIKENANRIRAIEENGKILGLAAISTTSRDTQDFLSIRTIGGLASSVHARDGSSFIGYIDCIPTSAKRDLNTEYAASKSTLEKWAKEQLNLLMDLHLEPIQWYHTASNLSNFSVDPTSITYISIVIDRRSCFTKIRDLVILAQNIDVIIFKSHNMDHATVYHSVQYVDNYIMIKAIRGGNFMSLEMDGDTPKDNYSLISCIHKFAISEGKNPLWRSQITDAKDITGAFMQALILSVK